MVRFETSRGEVCRGPGGLIFARPFADLWLASAAGVAEGIIHSRRQKEARVKVLTMRPTLNRSSV